MSRLKAIETEENLACNLIPMIDIMFLLLLFFMLSADMTTKELEDVTLPQNMEKAKKDDDKVRLDYDTHFFAIVHQDPNNKAPDLDETHWQVKFAGDVLNQGANWDGVKARLKELSSLPGEKEPAPSTFNRSAVILRCDRLAPYGTVQRLIQTLAEAGFYKIEVGAGLPAPKGPVMAEGN